MEENEVIEDGLELSAAMMKEIEQTVERLKTAHPTVRIIYPIVVEGIQEQGEKEFYVAYFQQPNFKLFSKYLAASAQNQAVAQRTLAKDCFLDGDRDLVDDDSLFLFGTMGQMGKMIEMRHGRLVNLSKTRK
jgi:hypothetical protein